VDLSEPTKLVPAASAAPTAHMRWQWRVAELVSAYLPVLLMALLAGSTWWLVKNTPQPASDTPAPVVRHEPDYTMQRFVVQRFAPTGRLRAQIEGDEMRHFPDTDTLEIDGAHMRMISPTQHVTLANARRALVNGDATEVQLLGGAQVVREAAGEEPAIEFRGEFLHAFVNTERVRSHLPVTLRRGTTEIRADTLDYDNLQRVVLFKGRVRANFAPAGSRAAGAYTQGVVP
jgi:lipopolysaccharide export system protein LptC